MDSNEESEHEAPILSEQGAALLADVVKKRSRSVRKPAGEDNQEQPPSPQEAVTIGAGPADAEDSAPSSGVTSSRVLVMLAAVVFVGFIALGVAAASVINQGLSLIHI